MRRSASMQGISATLPRSHPITPQTAPQAPSSRLAARRNSAKQLSKPSPAQELSDVCLLRTQNASLRAQNQRLREQLAALGVRSEGTTLQSDQKGKDYRQIIRNKFTSRVKTSRITTECETALLSSKEASLDASRITLEELYQNCLMKRMPGLRELSEAAERFFAGYCDNYAKLKVMLNCLEDERNRPQYQRLTELLQLYRLPLLYQKNPQVLFRELSRSKQKGRKERGDECLEVLSPQETVGRLEALLQKLCRSTQMMRLLRNNEHVLRFISKIENCKY